MELNIGDLTERETWSSATHSWLTCFPHSTPGHFFLTVFNSDMKQVIWKLNVNEKDLIRPFNQSPDNQLEIAASLDGRCVAYLSEQGGGGYALILKPPSRHVNDTFQSEFQLHANMHPLSTEQVLP